MAIITMRELLRTPGRAFEQVDEGETCLVTRNGRPVAALVPVTEAEAEKFVLAASPEFAQDRREAADARAEGQTTSLEEVAERFGVAEPGPPDEAREALARYATAFAYSPSQGGHEESVARVEKLHGQLLREFVDAGARDASDEPAESAEAWGWAVNQVIGFKEDIDVIGRTLGSETPTVYEAYVLGGIGAIERIRQSQRQVGEETVDWIERILGPPEPAPG
jgi:antitoxin (DNA-binding transcriptional repressor) of toxin-antitoxin stability system